MKTRKGAIARQAPHSMTAIRVFRTLLLIACLAPLAVAQSAVDVEAVVTTDMGPFRIELYPEQAPKHVAQFLDYSRNGFYEGTTFFRVLANGLIQGGDP